ncbi:tripartite tricarboxylate transporter TctB family protein [Denitrobaculum tricleocarpae]|uniref:Tripartite tricarboxylate transporter TctB family protein n=1 Tax=Denitrobaculum tricleocarpae TaxID=2591009 RepID=A0A545SXX8_9PROT|nr:tripartite tricarboxylate transporter TctB family protein [Denitrobaculum tricleocarpae]TQV69826.1 tripartite tricarboxylate transporter TctB family protein [Denitrobaculum tricleocarpae]
MHNRTIQIQLGVGALLASGFLLLVAIPNWVSSPSNVPNIILSPLFWPNTLAGLTGLVGLGLLLTSIRSPKLNTAAVPDVDDRAAAYVRLFAMAVIMGLTMFALPRLGMVWTSMLAFASVAFLIRTSHPVAALISAVVMPLVLYIFFAHVAGVAIPQGVFVRLP